MCMAVSLITFILDLEDAPSWAIQRLCHTLRVEQIPIRRCNVHFARILGQNSRKERYKLGAVMKFRAPLRAWLWSFAALAFVPSQQVVPGFNFLRDWIHDYLRVRLARPALVNRFDLFMTYIFNEYFKDYRRILEWHMVEAVQNDDPTTSNDCESYNHSFHSRTGPTKPKPAEYFNYIQKEEQRSRELEGTARDRRHTARFTARRLKALSSEANGIARPEGVRWHLEQIWIIRRQAHQDPGTEIPPFLEINQWDNEAERKERRAHAQDWFPEPPRPVGDEGGEDPMLEEDFALTPEEQVLMYGTG